MTLQDLSDIAQIVSSGAVIVSLVYLAIQIRQNTTQIRANSRIQKLTLQENFVATQQEMMVRLAENHMTFQASEVEPLEQERTLVQIDFFAPLPAFQAWWQRQNRFFGFDRRFVALVDERIARARAASPRKGGDTKASSSEVAT